MFMNRIRIAPEYSANYLEIERPSPMSDNTIESLILDVMSGKIDADITDQVYDDFKFEAEKWIRGSTLNNLLGLETYTRKDIMIGCTQFIDNIYMQGPVQTLRDDYRYHKRLGKSIQVDADSLISNVPLIIAMPFPQIGAPHDQMDNILKQCLEKNIPVHIDGAWVTCCRDVTFDFRHPAIKSVGISLSKGLGLGWNRIGIRWTKEPVQDSISIMNDFNMNNRALAIIGLYFIRKLPIDYLWKRYYNSYEKVCKDFGLEKTNAIQLALKDGQPVGVSPLLRYLNEA
jgi:hypothetical protein